MEKRQPKSFAEVTFLEAIARLVRVDLVMSPVVAGGERRLISRFLGIAGPQRIALAPPWTVKGRKVFVPVDWRLGLSFELGELWFQATTDVLEHAMFPRFPTRKVDALIVRQPSEVRSTNRRSKARTKLDPTKPFLATIWPGEFAENTEIEPLQVGKLHDCTEEGLGVRLPKPLALEVGAKAIIRLDVAAADERAFFWGVLKHCTPTEGDAWVAGFGQVTSVRPGEAVNLMAFLAAASG